MGQECEYIQPSHHFAAVRAGVTASGLNAKSDWRKCWDIIRAMAGVVSKEEAVRSSGARLYQLTLLFSDLSGYTTLMETADPEDVDLLRRRLAEAAQRTVEKHG